MTNIALLSDIHGNKDALSAVLIDARAKGVQRIFVCGDITGYYYNTAEVWADLKVWDAVMCHGNHETILKEWIDGNEIQRQAIKQRYGSSYQLAAETMDAGSLTALLALPHPKPITIDGVRFLLSHGAPWNEDIYLYPDMKEEDRTKFNDYAADYDVILTGHTHYQMATHVGETLIINPGSVGQPRSGKEIQNGDSLSRAQWALYDTGSRTCQLMTSYYNPSNIFEQVDQYDPGLSYLKNVLKRQDKQT